VSLPMDFRANYGGSNGIWIARHPSLSPRSRLIGGVSCVHRRRLGGRVHRR
jgi:hypothetical protein